jgi:hypothetical protein
MSHLINNELIWVSIPKCASFSVEEALRKSKLKLEFIDENDRTSHYHTPLNRCLDQWGRKESICITRDWLSRWLSALNYVWDQIEFECEYYTPIRKWVDIDNEYIFKTFDTNFLNELHLISDAVGRYGKSSGLKSCWFKLVNEEPNPSELMSPGIDTLISQIFYKSNKKCTYEFDITEIDKFTDFIEDRFGERLIINHTNKTSKRPNKIIVNDELKSFIWDNFEKRFEKKNILI